MCVYLCVFPDHSVTMTTKRGLITDSYKVVKKGRRGGKRGKAPTPPPPEIGEQQRTERIRT